MAGESLAVTASLGRGTKVSCTPGSERAIHTRQWNSGGVSPRGRCGNGALTVASRFAFTAGAPHRRTFTTTKRSRNGDTPAPAPSPARS